LWRRERRREFEQRTLDIDQEHRSGIFDLLCVLRHDTDQHGKRDLKIYKKPSLNTQQLCCWDEKDILTKSG
jgi:hypothetical protein